MPVCAVEVALRVGGDPQVAQSVREDQGSVGLLGERGALLEGGHCGFLIGPGQLPSDADPDQSRCVAYRIVQLFGELSGALEKLECCRSFSLPGVIAALSGLHQSAASQAQVRLHHIQVTIAALQRIRVAGEDGILVRLVRLLGPVDIDGVGHPPCLPWPERTGT